MFPSLHCNTPSPLIRLFSVSPFFSTGLMKLLPEADWDIVTLSCDFAHYRVEHATYYAIALTGCSPIDIARSLQWLQNEFYQLSFPTLLLVDEMTPLVRQQTVGTNTVVIDAKISLQEMRDTLLLWLYGK